VAQNEANRRHAAAEREIRESKSGFVKSGHIVTHAPIVAAQAHLFGCCVSQFLVNEKPMSRFCRRTV